MEESGKRPFRVRYALPLTLFPFLCGIGTAVPLWGEKAERIFFATAAVALVASLALGQWWQRQAHDLVDTEPESLAALPLIPVVAVLVFVVLVVYALLGLATDLLVRAIERKALAWRRGLVAR